MRWLLKHGGKGCAVCLETTGRYGEAVAEALYAAGFRVSVVNPARIRGYADAQLRRNKTDKLDAQLIADFCRTQQPEPWTPPDPELRQLQALVRHLTALEETRQQLTNRLRDGDCLPDLGRAPLQAQLTLLLEQLKQLQQAIQDPIDHFPDLPQQRDLIDSIPGLRAVDRRQVPGRMSANWLPLPASIRLITSPAPRCARSRPFPAPATPPCTCLPSLPCAISCAFLPNACLTGAYARWPS